ncbi:MAG TPA: NADH-quinone oxidoreductase subunit C [Acidimicrobiales bacterium]|nr:NADH-quinone oxidoreductase subunit C [Acidimicrobiales bacterium]
MSGLRRSIDVSAQALHDRVKQELGSGYRLALVAAHDDGDSLRVVYVLTSGPPDQRLELTVRLDAHDPRVPTLSDISFPASRFERQMHDTFGIVPEGHPFLRPLVRHSHWPEYWYPMRRDAGPTPAIPHDGVPYPFIEVQGAGVYEMPVGPVHAALIEPGHFRFSVVGETILKMTARLWFLHRGIERMFQGVGVNEGLQIAERISGDTAVGHGLAYCMAVEEAKGIDVPHDARVIRSVLLELERIYNHVGDIGAMCSDVSFGVAHARAMVIREQLLRLNESVTGHRLLRGSILPGLTSLRRLPTSPELDNIASELSQLMEFISSNTTVSDRFEGTAVLAASDAEAIGTLGVVARASGQRVDARLSHPFVSGASAFRLITQSQGDVHARFTQRSDEVKNSLELIRGHLALSPRLESTEASSPRGSASGLGIVEGWRGSIVHRVELDGAGVVSRCCIADPSFFNWPALATSLADTIVPDFPLVNKSFNLSYAGNDL